MINKLSTSEAVEILLADEYANWTYEGAKALVEWLKDLECEMGIPIELNPIALRGQFDEYRDVEEAAEDYHIHPFFDSLEWLSERGVVIEFKTGLIVGEFSI